MQPNTTETAILFSTGIDKALNAIANTPSLNPQPPIEIGNKEKYIVTGTINKKLKKEIFIFIDTQIQKTNMIESKLAIVLITKILKNTKEGLNISINDKDNWLIISNFLIFIRKNLKYIISNKASHPNKINVMVTFNKTTLLIIWKKLKNSELILGKVL